MLKAVKRSSGAVFAGSAYQACVMGQRPVIPVRTSDGSGSTGSPGRLA